MKKKGGAQNRREENGEVLYGEVVEEVDEVEIDEMKVVDVDVQIWILVCLGKIAGAAGMYCYYWIDHFPFLFLVGEQENENDGKNSF